MGDSKKAVGYCAKHDFLVSRKKLREKCKNRLLDGRICAYFNYSIPSGKDRVAAKERKKYLEDRE